MDQDQLHELRELVEFLKANQVAEFDMEQPEFKVRLKFAGAAPPATDLGELSRLMASRDYASAASVMPVSVMADDSASTLAQVREEVLHTVKSPIVGTFYESPSPGAPAFVKIGDQVDVGQVLCIIEAMKLMNEVEADASGEVVKQVALSGQPVEYGQALFTIRPR